jgi:hypothetical protein
MKRTRLTKEAKERLRSGAWQSFTSADFEVYETPELSAKAKAAMPTIMNYNDMGGIDKKALDAYIQTLKDFAD